MTVTLIVHNAKKKDEYYDDIDDDPIETDDDEDYIDDESLSEDEQEQYENSNISDEKGAPNISEELGGIIEVAEDDYSDSAFTDADIMSMGDSAFSQADYDDKVAADDYSDSAFGVQELADALGCCRSTLSRILQAEVG